MYVVVGLGNPGKQYENTRHNVGFNVIDILAKEYDISVTKITHKALIGEGRIYNYYKVDMENIIVIYDDIDLDVGKLRIRKKGSAGTHNGMRSIIKCLGAGDFPRIRVGVSKPMKGQDLADFVLSRFRKEEQADLEIGLEKAYKAVESMIKENIDMAMNKYNG